MKIKSTHPEYDNLLDYWFISNDCYCGELAIKKEGEKYLPPTSGHILDGQGKGSNQLGERSYQAYKTRAVFPHLYREAINGILGILHREPAQIELPKHDKMAYLIENATLGGDSLLKLLSVINKQQLITGRVGLLADTNENGQPIIIQYNDTSIKNWKTTKYQELEALVLDESNFNMQMDLGWKYQEQYRLLTCGEFGLNLINNNEYSCFTSNEQLSLENYITPSIMGETLDEIPFVFINAIDLSISPSTPYMIGLALLNLAIYRGEADYRQSLFMQGQDTLVRKGVISDDEEPVRTGANGMIDVPINGDAKYIGVSSQGLSEQRAALENDYKRASALSSQLLSGSSKESAEALRIRVSNHTSLLPELANTGAMGLERLLKIIAKWVGANPDDVKVTPNLNFTDADLDGTTLVKILEAKMLGAPISHTSVHDWLSKRGLSSLTYDQELEAIANEDDGIDFVGEANDG